jgi:hypothetical protein
MNKYQLSSFASLLSAGLGALAIYYTHKGALRNEIPDWLGYTIGGFFLLLGLLLFTELLARYWRIYPASWLGRSRFFTRILHFNWAGNSPTANVLKSIFLLAILAFMMSLVWGGTIEGSRGLNFYLPLGFLGFLGFVIFLNVLKWIWVLIKGS